MQGRLGGAIALSILYEYQLFQPTRPLFHAQADVETGEAGIGAPQKQIHTV